MCPRHPRPKRRSLLSQPSSKSPPRRSHQPSPKLSLCRTTSCMPSNQSRTFGTRRRNSPNTSKTTQTRSTYLQIQLVSWVRRLTRQVVKPHSPNQRAHRTSGKIRCSRSKTNNSRATHEKIATGSSACSATIKSGTTTASPKATNTNRSRTWNATKQAGKNCSKTCTKSSKPTRTRTVTHLTSSSSTRLNNSSVSSSSNL